MITILYFLAKLVSIGIELISYAMIARVLIPLFTGNDEGRIYQLSVILTEPLILPVRLVFAKFNWFGDSPIDMPFFATYLILSFIRLVLPVI